MNNKVEALKIKTEARNLFIFKRMACTSIAKELGKNADTIRRWKREAKTSGDDWDKARSANVIAGDGLEQVTTSAAMVIIQLLEQQIKEVEQNQELSSEDKIKQLTLASDTMSKVVASAGKLAPKISELGVAMDVLKMLAEFIRQNHPKEIELFMAVLEPFSETLVEVYQ